MPTFRVEQFYFKNYKIKSQKYWGEQCINIMETF
jgi:hypothetical protein